MLQDGTVEPSGFRNRALKVTPLHFHNSLVITLDSPMQFGRKPHAGVGARKLVTTTKLNKPDDAPALRVDSRGVAVGV